MPNLDDHPVNLPTRQRAPSPIGEEPATAAVLTTANGHRYVRYHGPKDVVQYFAHLPGARTYDAGATLVVPLSRDVVMALEVLGRLETGDAAYAAAVRDLLRPSERSLSHYPDVMGGAPEPKPHQVVTFGWCLDAMIAGRGGVGVFNALGSGKTRSAIDLGRQLVGGSGRVLVIGQKTTLEQWSEELDRAWPGVRPHVIHRQGGVDRRQHHLEVLRKLPLAAGETQAILVNWESLHPLLKPLQKFGKFEVVVADEASRLLGRTTKMARAAKSLAWHHSWHRIVLTGTPIRRSVEDLLALFQFVDTTVFGSRIRDFRERYCEEVATETGQIASEPRADAVVDLVRQVYSAGFRVSRAAVDLPEPLRRTVRLEPSSEQRQALRRLETLPTVDTEGVSEPERFADTPPTSDNVLARLLRMQQITAGFTLVPTDDPAASREGASKVVMRPRPLPDPKLEWIEAFLAEQMGTEDGKFLVWTRFIPEIERVHGQLADRFGAEVVARLDGSVRDARRQEIRHAINDRCHPCRVLVCNLQTGAMGLDLPGVDVLIYHSNTYNYVDRTQSEGRGTRLGRTTPGQVIDLVLTGTVDEHVAEILARKQSVSDLLVGRGFTHFRGAA